MATNFESAPEEILEEEQRLGFDTNEASISLVDVRVALAFLLPILDMSLQRQQLTREERWHLDRLEATVQTLRTKLQDYLLLIGEIYVADQGQIADGQAVPDADG